MTEACTHEVAAERWIDFFAGDLGEASGKRLEQLLFECAQCAAQAERWGALVGTIASAIPPVISTGALRALQHRDQPMNENPMRPGEQRRASFPSGGDLLIHRLGGLELSSTDRLNLALSTPAGSPLVRFEDVPFDADTGEVLVACQRHFGESFPPDIVFEVERSVGERAEVLARYEVDHVDWAKP